LPTPKDLIEDPGNIPYLNSPRPVNFDRLARVVDDFEQTVWPTLSRKEICKRFAEFSFLQQHGPTNDWEDALFFRRLLFVLRQAIAHSKPSVSHVSQLKPYCNSNYGHRHVKSDVVVIFYPQAYRT
jgi:hypothetical protein